MKGARWERVDGDVNRLPYFDGPHNRIRHSHYDLHDISAGEFKCWQSRSYERSEFYGLLHNVAGERRDQSGIAQGNLCLRRLRLGSSQLCLRPVMLCARRLKLGLCQALSIVEARGTIEVKLRLYCGGLCGIHLRCRLAYLVLILSRANVGENGPFAHAVAFRDIANASVSAHLLKRSNITRDAKRQRNLRVGRHHRRETHSVANARSG